KLGPARGGSQRPDEAVPGRAGTRGRGAGQARRAPALHRRPRALFPGDPRAHGRRRGADRRQRPPRAGRCRQLRRAPGQRHGRPRRPGRPAPAGPVHPHRWRPPDQQLPALAAGLHRAVVHRHALARRGRQRAAACPGRLRPARAPVRPDQRADRRSGDLRMTRTRVIAALVMAPTAIAAILLLPTPWLAAVAALAMLTGLWEWLKLAGVDDSLPRTVLVGLNLLLMVLLVWASRSEAGFSPVLFQLATLAGAAGWVLSLLWLRRPGFGAADRPANRALKLAAGTLAVVPAWCALCLVHSDSFAALGGPGEPMAHRWLLAALAL